MLVSVLLWQGGPLGLQAARVSCVQVSCCSAQLLQKKAPLHLQLVEAQLCGPIDHVAAVSR
jgi:hypothetical protein